MDSENKLVFHVRAWGSRGVEITVLFPDRKGKKLDNKLVERQVRKLGEEFWAECWRDDELPLGTLELI